MEHLHTALCLSGATRGKELTEEAQIIAALHDPELAWLHLRADHADTRRWVEENMGYLDRHVLGALLANETRPRVLPIDNGLMVILRGVNKNEGADPEDMVSVRLWLDPARIVSMSIRKLTSIGALYETIKLGEGPETAGGFLVALIRRLNRNIENFLAELDDKCDGLDDMVIDRADIALRSEISDTRQKVIRFRRYIAPQRDAIGQLLTLDLPLFVRSEQRQLMEAHDQLTRTVEDLDTIRDRLQVIKDELQNAQSERINRNLYLLSIVSAVFLPLGFLTGLMGVNLAGMPGASAPIAFWLFAVILVVVAVILGGLLRLLRWF